MSISPLLWLRHHHSEYLPQEEDVKVAGKRVLETVCTKEQLYSKRSTANEIGSVVSAQMRCNKRAWVRAERSTMAASSKHREKSIRNESIAIIDI